MPGGSAAAFWLAQLTQVQMEQVIEECAVQGAKDYVFKCEALWPAIHMRKKPPAQRLQDYQERPQRNWDLMRAIFPQVYKEQTDDWHNLESEFTARTIVPPAPAAPPPLPEQIPNIVTPGFGIGKALPSAAERRTREVEKGFYPADNPAKAA